MREINNYNHMNYKHNDYVCKTMFGVVCLSHSLVYILSHWEYNFHQEFFGKHDF